MPSLLCFDGFVRVCDCVLGYWYDLRVDAVVANGVPREEAIRMLKKLADQCGYDVVERTEEKERT